MKKDIITLVRVRSLKIFPCLHGQKSREDDDYPVYERDKDGDLHRIFFQLNDQAERIYVDHKPDDPEVEKFLGEGMPEDGYDTALEAHDDEYTEYGDYSDAKYFLSQCEYYLEVKK